MNYKTHTAIFIAITLWASAFVGIRYGLNNYSPEGLALLRYLIASAFLGCIYLFLPNKTSITTKDKFFLLFVGAIGIGIYNLTLNYGERSISSGIASFLTSQAPMVTMILAVILIGERIKLIGLLGVFISTLGIFLITLGELKDFHWDDSLYYLALATITGGSYSVLQKPVLNKYHVVEITTWLVWGGTLFLMFYLPHLQQDIKNATIQTTLAVIYLGIFPAAIGYLAWSYVLAQISASRASVFLYAMPFVATLLGWICLNEIPAVLSLLGGTIAIGGVWLVNRAEREKLSS